MELTIEQALQQGAVALKEGKLQDAERLYRAILQSQPAHPDANHNLGVLAVSVNKAKAALPLFKTALDANPNIDQFWLSYIDALIREKQFDNAKQVIDQAKKQGVDGEKLNIIKVPLASMNEAVNADSETPSQQQLSSLLEHYQNGRLNYAEKLAVSITNEFPKHQFAWKVLGAVLKQTGRVSDSLRAMQRSVDLMPQDAEAYSNLGITLKELSRLDEAEASYNQAIALNPDYAEAHSNLGNVLKELGRLDEALASYNQAIALKPNFAEAHYNLGNTLQDLGRLDEAVASYNQAIVVKPDYAEAKSNLGNTLKELGRLDEALASCSQAIALKPDYAEAHYNLGNTLQELGRLEEAVASYTEAITLKPENIRANNQLLICLFLQDKKSVFFDELDNLINQNKVSAVIGSLACRSALKYGLEKPNSFCTKPLNYVLHNHLNSQCDFEKTFVKKVKSILNENWIAKRRQSLLVNGYQTSGNIFDLKNDDTNEIQNIIRIEVEKYRTKFEESEEGLIKKMPADYSLYGWLISMKSGGNLKPHIHEEGWLSGSVYINVPRKSTGDSGNLVVSIGDEKDTIDTTINEKKIINVVTGSMVLFPASLMHYTIPFESEEERIVLAFDVKAK